MKSLITAVAAYLFFTGTAFSAPCAKTVSAGQSNGVYDHLLQMSDGETWLELSRQSDGINVGVGIDRGRFKMEVRGIKVAVKVCIKGENSITAGVGVLNGEVTKLEDGTFDVIAPFSYSGIYVIQE